MNLQTSTWEIVSQNRRTAPRHQARIPTSVTLAREWQRLGHADRPPALLGYTKDISAEGLALLVPSINLSEQDLTELDATLRVVLALPAGYVEATAVFVRCQHLQPADRTSRYLVALKIKKMDPADTALYNEYLHSLN